MRRVITVGLLILVCFLLQSSVFTQLDLGGITPNLLIVLTASFGFMRGEKEGMFIGFICGLLMDIFYAEYMGLYSLVYLNIGFFNNITNSHVILCKFFVAKVPYFFSSFSIKITFITKVCF